MPFTEDLDQPSPVVTSTATTAASGPSKGFVPDMTEDVQVPTKTKNTATAGSRAMEIPRGFNAGVMGALGLPMDTMVNAGNLGAAGLEAGMLAAGQVPPPAMDPIKDTSKIPLTSAWLRKKATEYFGDQTSMAHPEDMASRYLYGAGTALPSALSRQPASIPEAATSATGAALAGAGGQGGAELAHVIAPHSATAQEVGNLGGQLLTGAVMGRVAQPVKPPDAARQAAVNMYDQAGIPVDSAQRTGNEFLRKVNAGLTDNPLTTAYMKGFKNEQQEGGNRLMLRTVGENEPKATQVVMDRAKTTIGDEFDRIAAKTRIPYDPKLQQDLVDIEQRVEREVPDSHKGLIRTQINDILQNASANSTPTPTGPVHWMDGGAFQKIQSSLNNLSRSPEAQPVVQDLQSALHDALQRGALPEDQAALAEARRQYRNLMQIEPAVSKEGEGNISPQTVTNVQGQKKNRNQSVYGRGDQELGNVARGARLLQADLPNSGTPSRIMAAALPTVLGGGLGALIGHGPHEMGLGTAIGAGLSQYGTLAAMHSPLVGKYLAHGVTNPYIRNILQTPASAPYRATLPAQVLIDRYNDEQQ